MKRYSMVVKRRLTETMRFTVEAASAAEAHSIAEQDVRAGKHPGQSPIERVTVQTCHPVLEDKP